MRQIFPFILFIVYSLGANAQSNNSTTYRFLDVSPTAKSVSLGSYQVGLYDADFSMLHLNPAYLTLSNSNNYSATFINYLADAKMGLVNTHFSLKNIGVIGISLRFSSYGDFDFLDENGNDMGNFTPYDLSLTSSFATFLDENLSAGISLDLISSTYQDFSSQGISLSGGLFYKDTTSHFSAGLSVRNLGTQLKSYNGINEPLPLDVAVGITKKPENFPIEMSLTLRRLQDWDSKVIGEINRPGMGDELFRHLVAGGEVSFSENFHGRVGYNHLLHEQTKSGSEFDFAGFSFGIGFNIKQFIIDISRSSYSSSGGFSQISIQTKL